MAKARHSGLHFVVDTIGRYMQQRGPIQSPTFHLLVVSSTGPAPVMASIIAMSARCFLVISCWLR